MSLFLFVEPTFGTFLIPIVELVNSNYNDSDIAPGHSLWHTIHLVTKKRDMNTHYHALSPLIYLHVNPYGQHNLDMGFRLPINEIAISSLVFH